MENLRALLIGVREGERIIAREKSDFKRFVKREDGPPGGPSPISLEVKAYPEFCLETAVALEIEQPGDVRPIESFGELDVDR